MQCETFVGSPNVRKRFVAVIATTDRLAHLVGVRSHVAAIVKGRFGSKAEMVIAFGHDVPPDAVEVVLGRPLHAVRPIWRRDTPASTSAGPHILAGNAGLCHYPARRIVHILGYRNRAGR